jgi:protein-disulfide isomerase-like protein with CxxC motif
VSTDVVRFHFDPVCPWAYQTSCWARRLAELDVLELRWGVFSLPLNAEGSRGVSEKALRTVVLVRGEDGEDAAGRFYAGLGRRVHERGEPLDDDATLGAALRDAALDETLLDKARGDEATWDTVVDEHRRLVERTRSFGVPTIVLDGGEGPAIFGPVIGDLPSDEDAVALWRHVAWLTRYEGFAELKRERTVEPDLVSHRRYVAAQQRREDAS